MEWDVVHSDLRISLLGWLTLRTVDQILEEAIEMVDALESVATTNTITEMGEKVMIDVVGLCTALMYAKNNEKHSEVSTETDDLKVEGGVEDSKIEYSNRLESKIEKLRMKWAGSEYEIVLEKLEMLESWKTEEDAQRRNT